MEWKLSPLPYGKRALEPHIGAETLEYHHDKHHGGYLTKLHEEIAGTPLGRCSLDELVVGADGTIFDLAAQVWNHDFHWRSMSPDGGGTPPKELLTVLERAFGSFDDFRAELVDAAVGAFGAGWAWLYRHREDRRLAIATTPNAETPFAVGHVPLLAIDVWEHAYYLDYRHERQRYVEAVVDHLLNWEFVRTNLAAAM